VRRLGLLATLLVAGAAPFATPALVRAEDPEADARYDDAAIDRVLFLPSGETHPEGTLYAADYELLGLRFGYALTDDVEVAIAGAPPIPDLPFAYELGGKLNVARTDTVRAALFASFGIFVSNDREVAIGGRIGAAVSLCLDDACSSYATLSGGVLLTDQVATALPIALGMGVVARLDRYLALVVEPLYGRVVTAGDADDDVFVLSYAARIGAADWSLDVGLVRPFVPEIVDDSPLVLGVPWIAFTYRGGFAPPRAP
jgi:hypothetical protein